MPLTWFEFTFHGGKSMRANTLLTPAVLWLVAVCCVGCDATTTVEQRRDPPTACAAPGAEVAQPRSVGEAVEAINAMSQPVTLDCFLESLQRPLSMAATASARSVQPAVGARSPRVFILSGDLVMSVATAGNGIELLEFGEFVEPTHSVKAEIHFPVEEPLAATAPFTRVGDEQGTACRFCHADETKIDDPYNGYAFASGALQPSGIDRVSVADLRAESESCDASAEPVRCARLDALFGHGLVVSGTFPPGVPTSP
ncbi:MAG: hypothetical protein JKY37_00755 [Nannocystaceae bacterium]|nr:hypothetical protein [Nannocystaceae bacterium]